MPVVKLKNLEFAVKNIARFGDTDVFPFPLENHWLHDEPQAVVQILQDFDANFDAAIANYPVVFNKSLAGVGYAGFRAATQIDPIWNAYLFALVLEVAPDIERARVPRSQDVVFAYRFQPNPEGLTVFEPSIGWGAYQESALARADHAQFVLSTDISDFYSRIYHHRLENALDQATANKDAANRIMVLLFDLAAKTSYGLPVGGNAARLLAELLLDRADRLLLAQAVDFVRFVDDYYIFAASRADAQTALVLLSEALLVEGLGLSRAKTRLMTRAEFKRSSPVAQPAVAESTNESEARTFLKLRLRYDPYSATADADYEALSEELERFDIVAMLAREFSKSRVDEILVRQLVKSVRFLKPRVREQAIESILQNLGILYPIFPTVVILLRQLFADLNSVQQSNVCTAIRQLLKVKSHITRVPTNLAYALQLLGHDPDPEADRLLVDQYAHGPTDMMLKRDITLAMARRRATYWLSPQLRRYSELTPWEQRALLVASYVLGDEGSHWRRSIQVQLCAVNKAFLGWLGRKNAGRAWDIPT